MLLAAQQQASNILRLKLFSLNFKLRKYEEQKANNRKKFLYIWVCVCTTKSHYVVA